MKVCTCFLLFRIFAYAYSKTHNASLGNQRSVNLALETVLEFHNKDNAADIRFLDNVQKFITKVKSVIDTRKNLRRNLGGSKVVTFTDFIQQVVNILNGYEDVVIKNFFGILDDEIRKYHYRGCKFYELTENYEIRKLFAEKLNLIRAKPVFVTKTYINVIAEMLKVEGYSKNVKEMVDYINSLYRHAGEKFQKVLSDLDDYSKTNSKRSNNRLIKIVRNGVRSLIFDHYTQLNANARRELKDKIETFWKQFKEKPPANAKTNKIPYTAGKQVNNAKHSEKIMPGIKMPATERDAIHTAQKKIENKRNPTHTAQQKTENNREAIKKYENFKDRIEIKQSDYKKMKMMQDGLKDEKKGNKYNRKEQPNVNQQRTKNRNQEQSRHLSSDELLEESFERISIEFSQERQREFNTQRYMTLYPEEITFKSTMTTEKPEKAIHRSVKTMAIKSKAGDRVQTMWVEEVTGRLPKAHLDKMSTTPKLKQKSIRKTSHESNNLTKNKKKYTEKNEGTPSEKRNEPKHDNEHGKRYELKYEKKHKTKHRSVHGPKYQSMQGPTPELKHDTKSKSWHNTKHKYDIPSKHNAKYNADVLRINDAGSKNKEQYEYKKNIGPVMVDVKQEIRLASTITPKEPVHTKSIPTKPTLPRRPAVTTKPTVSPRPPLSLRISMKPAQQSSSNFPTKSTLKRLKTGSLGVHANRFELLTGDHRDFKKSAERLLFSNEGLPIENTERDTKYKLRSLRKSSSVERSPSVIKMLKKLERELNEVKSKIKNVNTDVFKAKKVKDETKNKIEKGKKPEIKMRTDENEEPSDFKLKKDNIVKLASPIDIKPDYQVEYKFVKEKGSNFKEIFKNGNKTTEVTKRNEIIKDDKNKEKTYTNYIYGVTHKEKEKDTKGVKLMIEDLDFNNEKHTNNLKNYEVVDEWKDALKMNKNTDSRITTTKATVSPTDTTTKSTTTVKTTETTTSTTPYIPVTIPVASYKRPDVLNKNAINITGDDNNNKMAKNTSEVANNADKTTMNVNKAYTNEVQKEIVYSNVTAAPMNVDNVTNVTKLQSIVKAPTSAENRRVFQSGFNTNMNGDVTFTDPFDDIDIGLLL